ncbi:Ulp1 protease family, carboxy-terminal domain protein [Spatholobus suberectus]|nr:Ulp1 protease family, carboxy-terminal domain protein [Spatholobus suberectus]
MIKGLNNLTNIVASQSPLMSPANACTTVPLVHTQTQTPCNGNILEPKEVEDVLAKLKTTTNASSASEMTKVRVEEKTSTLKDGSLKKRLFSQTIAGKNCRLFSEIEPFHNVHFDGMKTSVEIPKWLPMLFRPPPTMVIDDVQSQIAAYIFGTNKHDEFNCKEVIVTTTMKTVGDRQTLKTLMPKGLVDQEVINLVASMLTVEERSICMNASSWYLLTTVA